jgi:hypothetical protein
MYKREREQLKLGLEQQLLLLLHIIMCIKKRRIYDSLCRYTSGHNGRLHNWEKLSPDSSRLDSSSSSNLFLMDWPTSQQPLAEERKNLFFFLNKTRKLIKLLGSNDEKNLVLIRLSTFTSSYIQA